ncbi:MAG: penicillin-binding protein 2 [Minisyncoccia bacterium]|jgi:penicillin-binding protein 2
MKQDRFREVAFEDSLHDDWSRDLDVAEVPIGRRPFLWLGAAVFCIALAVAARIVYLNWASGAYYAARAEDNVAEYKMAPAPRGTIYDREGDVLAESKAAFAAVLDTRAYVNDESLRADTARIAQSVLGISSSDFTNLVNQAAAQDFATPVVLAENLTQNELVNLQATDLTTIKVESEFIRDYSQGPVFSSVVGYTGRVSGNDLKANPSLNGADFIGKMGIEAYYDDALRGKPGVTVQYRNAQGALLREERESTPQVGGSLHLTIDGGLQSYFYSRLASGLRSLKRTVGVGLAIDPQTGEVLSLINLPGFDNNVFSQSGAGGTAEEISRLLSSSDKPLFNRAVGGFYNPGSTVKPLDAVAALKEGVIDPQRAIFSPGYLLVPNPYNSSTPSRYLDWRYQGSVNLAAALAQSSDVYFYIVGGGSPPASTPLLNDPSDYGVSGLGITRLYQWWETFGLGKPTGIDMPDEADGFLPTPDWKQERMGTPWLLGDTYNVSIGQGDLLVNPLQLLDYIGAIGNGGKIYRPFLNAASTPQVAEDLTGLLPQIREVQQGMREGVTSPQGTAYSLHDLPIDACAKTGSAQVANNQQENAFFVGYMPCENPQIALLVLIENSKEGSLNAVPIAKDVLNWYYWNRIVAQPALGSPSSTPGVHQ